MGHIKEDMPKGIYKKRKNVGGSITHPVWSSEEKKILKDKHVNYTFADIAKYFLPNRSESACHGKAHVMGLRKSRINRYAPYWTKERVSKIALKYSSQKEFKEGDSGAFQKARKSGWMKEVCSHMVRQIRPDGYWTEQTCKEAALECKTRTEFRNKYGGGSVTASKLGILDECCSHMKRQANLMKRLIYVFEFPETKTAYIGLTWNSEKRYKTHMKKGPVHKYINSTDSEFTYKKLTRRIKIENAVKKEKHFIEKYLEDGWSLLNKSLQAGHLGSPKKFWTRERIIEAAKTCKTRKELGEKYGGAPAEWIRVLNIPEEEVYGHMENLGYLNEKCSRIAHPVKYWTKKRILKDAKKYSIPLDWQENSCTAFQRSMEMGIYKEATAHMKPNPKGWRKRTKEGAAKEKKRYEDRARAKGITVTELKRPEGVRPLITFKNEEERRLHIKSRSKAYEKKLYSERRRLKRRGIVPLNKNGDPCKKTCRELYDKDGNLAPKEKWEELLK